MFYITISHVVSITSAVLCDFTGHSLRPMVTGFFLGDIRLCISLSIQLKQTHDTGFLGSWWWNIVWIWCYSKLFLYFKSKLSFLNWVSLHNTCLLIYLIVFMRMQRVKSGPRSALGVYYIWSLVNFLEQVRLWPCKFSWFNHFIQCWSMVKFCFLWRSALTPRLLSNPRTHWTVGRKGFFFFFLLLFPLPMVLICYYPRSFNVVLLMRDLMVTDWRHYFASAIMRTHCFNDA